MCIFCTPFGILVNDWQFKKVNDLKVKKLLKITQPKKYVIENKSTFWKVISMGMDLSYFDNIENIDNGTRMAKFMLNVDIKMIKKMEDIRSGMKKEN